MNQFELLSVVAAFGVVVTNLVLFGVFALQLRELRHQVKDAHESTVADHQRRRSQATIDFYAATLEKRSTLRSLLPHDRDVTGVQALVKSALEEVGNGQVSRDITEYLSLFELLATGVNTDVFDIAIIERVAGARIRGIASNYRLWIDERRKSFENPMLYCELIDLAATLEGRKSQGVLPAPTP